MPSSFAACRVVLYCRGVHRFRRLVDNLCVTTSEFAAEVFPMQLLTNHHMHPYPAAVVEPTTFLESVAFINDLAQRQDLNIRTATDALQDFEKRRVPSAKPMDDTAAAIMDKWESVHIDLTEECKASETSTQLEDIFDVGDMSEADCQDQIRKRKDVALQSAPYLTRGVVKRAERDAAAKDEYLSPEKANAPMLGLGLVGGLFGGSGSDGLPPLPEVVLAIRKAGDNKTNMSEHTTNRFYDYVNPASDRVKQHDAPIALEHLTPDVKTLCAALRHFMLSAVRREVHTRGSMSEKEVQQLFHPATIVLAHALAIDIDMRDGRGAPKLALSDGVTMLVGLLDVYGVMNYCDGVDVCAIDIELKVPRVLGGRQLVQVMDQLLALTARHTAGRVLDLNAVSASGVRCCLGLLSNGITGVAVSWLGPLAGATVDGIPRQKFFLESTDPETGIFGLLAEKMIKSVRLRARCLAENNRVDTSTAGKRYFRGGGGADDSNDDRPLPPRSQGGHDNGGDDGQEDGSSQHGGPLPFVLEGTAPQGDAATCTIGKKPKGLADISNQLNPVRRAETVLRVPIPPPVIEYNPFERFFAEGSA